MHCLMHWLDAMFDPWPPFTFCRPQAIVRTQEFRFQTHLPSPARRGSRSRPPLRRPRPLRFERLPVPVWNPYSRGRLSPAKSEDRKGGEGKTDANLTNFFSTCCALAPQLAATPWGGSPPRPLCQKICYSDCTENCPLRPLRAPRRFGIRKSASNSGHSPLRGLGGGLGGGLGDASPEQDGSEPGDS